MTIAKPLTTAQVATYLGHHRNTVTHLRERGEFPGAFMSMGQWRYPAADVKAYIDRNRSPAVETQNVGN